jgi:hypothetical protein
MVAEIQIFEDIFAPCITGTLAITDSLDLVNKFPFIGEEKVLIQIKTPSMPDSKQTRINQEFYIHKMTDRKVLGDKQIFYMLHFCSFELLADANLKLSRSFDGKISDIATKLVKTEILKTKLDFRVDETQNSVKYVSNYWSPYKNINYLLERAQNKDGTPNYVFFENRLGLNFVSLSNVFATKNKDDYTFDAYQRKVTPTGSIQEPEKLFSRFLDYTIETGFDYIKRTNSGMFGSKMVAHDILTKKYSTQNFSMFNFFNGETHLNKYPVVSPDIVARNNANIYNFPKYMNNVNGFGDDGVQNWLQRRTSLMAQAQAYRMTAEILGRTDITIGEVIYITIYKSASIAKSDDNNDLIDNLFSGRYLISALNHRITREKHEIHMECLKDSLIVNPATGKK